MSQLEFDEARALTIARHLITAWQQRTLGFRGLIPPEELHLPLENIAYGSRQHACLLFFWGFLTRMGQPSGLGLERSRQTIRNAPWIIDPLVTRPAEGTAPLKAIVPFGQSDGHRDKRVDGWQENLAKLKAEYGGDPRRIFLGARDRASLLEKLTSFRGIGSKISQLLTVWFQSVKWPTQQSRWQVIRQIVVFPVDIHVLRLVRQLEIVQGWRNDYHSVVTDPVSDFMVELCRRHGLDHITLSQAFWHLGSVIGRKRPKNMAEAGPYCLAHCPVNDWCKSIVTSPEYKSKGKVGWDTAVRRTNLFTP